MWKILVPMILSSTFISSNQKDNLLNLLITFLYVATATIKTLH